MNAEKELARLLERMQKEEGKVEAKVDVTAIPPDVADEDLRELGLAFLKLMQEEDDET